MIFLQIEEGELAAAASVTFLNAVGEFVVVAYVPDEQGGMRVVPCNGGAHIFFRAIGAAIAAEVGAASVPSEIAARDAEAVPAVSLMADRFEGAAVCFPDRPKRITAVIRHAAFFKCFAGSAGLERKPVFGGRFGEAPQEGGFLRVLRLIQIGNAFADLCGHFQKTDDAAAYIWCDLFSELCKNLRNTLGGIGFCRKDGLKSPYEPFFSDKTAQFGEGREPFRMRRDIGFDILSVSGQGVMEKRIEPIRDLMQPPEGGGVMFGTEQDGVHFVRLQKIARNAVRKERVARADDTFPKAFKEPVGIVMDDVGPEPRGDDHLPHLILAFFVLYPFFHALSNGRRRRKPVHKKFFCPHAAV